MGPGVRRAALRRLVEAGEVVPIEVKGSRARWLVLARDLPALARAARRREGSRGTTLLSPFDSLLWHRERVERLFGFSYRIEVYTPGPQRVHGYYTLPILHDGQLIGRVDAKAHRADRHLAVRHVHFERWFATGGEPPAASWGAIDQDEALAGVADALWSLARVHGRRPREPRPRRAGPAAVAARPDAPSGAAGRAGPRAPPGARRRRSGGRRHGRAHRSPGVTASAPSRAISASTP